MKQELNNQSTQIKNLEVQMGQMATTLSERQQGTLPSTLKVNPRREGKEHYKEITIKSGKAMENLVQVDENDKDAENAGNYLKNSIVREPKKDEVMTTSKEYAPIVPFPKHLKKKTKWISNLASLWMCSKSSILKSPSLML